MLRGTLAAALTPLRDGGARLDEEAVGPYVGEAPLAAVREANDERSRLGRLSQTEVEARILGGEVTAAGMQLLDELVTVRQHHCRDGAG